MPDNDLNIDKELFLRVANGDEKSFARLFDQYRPNIYTTALRITGSKVVAEEIVQDVFLKVWIKRSELPGIQNFAGWLYVVAQRYTLNALKLQKKTISIRTEMSVEPPVAEERLQDKQYEVFLQQAMEQLPIRQRETFQLIKIQNLSREEAAAKMGVSEETIKSNLDIAVRRVRAFLLKNFDSLTPIVLLSLVY